ELLPQPLGAQHPGRTVAAAGIALDDRVEVDRRSREAGFGSDQSGLDLPGPPPFAHRQVAEDAAAGAGVVGGDRLRPGPVANGVPCLVAGLARQVAVLDADDQVPAAAGVEAERRLALTVGAEGVFELVAVAPLLGRRDDLLQLIALETADPLQRFG